MELSLSDLVAKAAAAKTAQQGIADVVADFRRRIPELRKAIQRTRGALLPLGEAQANIPAIVREMAEGFLFQDGTSLLYGEQAPARPGLTRHVLRWSARDPLPLGLMAAADPAGTEAVLCAALARLYEHDQPEVGLPMAERQLVLAGMEAELQELERADEDLIDSANAYGVPIQHRSEVVTRRATEAEEARRRVLKAEADERTRLHDEAYERQAAARQRARA